jgi:hypothetical protein
MNNFIALILTFVCFSVAGETQQEKALSLYQKAQEALGKGQLQNAQKLVDKAIELHNVEGEIETNIRLTFEPIRVGRKREFAEVKTSDKHPYTPNQLRLNIAQKREAQFAQTRLLAKRNQPPKLHVDKVTFLNEDNNNSLSALEKGSLRFVVTNVGMHKAELVSVTIDSGSLELEDMTREFHIPSIQTGQSITLTTPFSMPKEVPSARSAIWLSIKEKDGLGEIRQQKIEFASRPYFAPSLEVTLIQQHSSRIVPGQPATLRYRVQNTGKETAWDIKLALEFAQIDLVEVLKNIDLPQIHQLTVGEYRDITFTIEPSHFLNTRVPLKLSLALQSRGQKEKYLDLALNTESEHENNPPHVNQLLASQALLDRRVARTNPNAAGFVINMLAAPKKGQVNNSTVATNVMRWGLGISQEHIHQTRVGSKRDWSNFIDSQLPQKIENLNTLHFYIDSKGTWEIDTNQASIIVENNYAQQQVIALNTILETLNELPVKHVIVYLESSFLATSERVSPVWIEQPLAKPYEKVMLLGAAGKNTEALTDVHNGTGLFTSNLSQAFNFLLSKGQVNSVSHRDLVSHLRESLCVTSKILHQQRQLGAFSAITNETLSLKNKGE